MKNHLRDLREAAGINQTRMAELVGVSRQSIHAIESGTFNPSVLLALKIAKVLKIDLAKIFVLEKGDFDV